MMSETSGHRADCWWCHKTAVECASGSTRCCIDCHHDQPDTAPNGDQDRITTTAATDGQIVVPSRYKMQLEICRALGVDPEAMGLDGQDDLLPTADPQWSDARVVGHVRLPNDEMRWIVEQSDGTRHRVVAVAVQDDWETPVPHGVGVNDGT